MSSAFVLTVIFTFFLQSLLFSQTQSFLENTNIISSPVIGEDSILFVVTNQARSVKLLLESEGWKPIYMNYDERVRMWYYIYEKELKKGKYRYKIVVDGIVFTDPLNPNREPDGIGGFFSVFELKDDLEIFRKNPKYLGNGYYEFRYKNLDAKKVVISGNFNNWNPYELEMKRESGGLWKIRLYLPKGTYYYQFIVDDEIVPDPLNPKTIRDKHGNVVNVIEIN